MDLLRVLPDQSVQVNPLTPAVNFAFQAIQAVVSDDGKCHAWISLPGCRICGFGDKTMEIIRERHAE
jgi:hypothetical protein